MSKSLRGTAILTGAAIEAAANGGVEITQDNPTRQACGDVTAYQERSRIYRGMVFSRDEIVQARDLLKKYVSLLDEAVTLFTTRFDTEHEVECKLACEAVASTARILAERRELYQIEQLARSLAGTFATHLARRPR